jgi:hypothetical protein
VAGLKAIQGCRRSLVNEGHADGAVATRLGVPAGQPLAATKAQNPPGELPGQTAKIGAIHGLVDRLGTQPFGRLVGEPAPEISGDLLRAPAGKQAADHPAAQLLVPGEAAGPAQWAASEHPPVGLERPIAAGGVGAAAELAADGRGGPTHQSGDVTQSCAPPGGGQPGGHVRPRTGSAASSASRRRR